ncbi:hypothetical protein N7499_010556 [Penicillium canescens]|uniref:Uncharacterized protein n=1 Tax=Penicillium canescens TaxID=5083 RepID=A0AAD6NC48_PENCN|nr:uncharacterized protein N7446_005824 [Penicillium canescens]KAJ6051193.1 hypothetical protein N7460_001727 [Penicillium canescens]KAJ6061704.1 hypothetical protein N7446_005824 [Penicillium canescens]KAJ6064952.1 hypothetical protein N7444_000605 [Penicillium canescens]KAJ6068669.1 hypothetical protein N7499_010556 [Penicillium canescens]KAJ6183277.1 hypothetical protein N7485_001919 [Penicillium canescens]
MSTVITPKSKGRFYARLVVSAHVRSSARSLGFTDHHLEHVIVDSDCVKTVAKKKTESKDINTKGVDPNDLKIEIKTEAAIEREQSMSLEG